MGENQDQSRCFRCEESQEHGATEETHEESKPMHNLRPDVLVDSVFETWALDSCQACPRCRVIVRKETGCDTIQCRCGTTFRYCCGAMDQGCVCHTRKGTDPQRLGKWLLVNGL